MVGPDERKTRPVAKAHPIALIGPLVLPILVGSGRW